MEITIKTPKGVYNAGQGWTGTIDEIVDELREFFNKKRLDRIAEIIKRGVVSDLDRQRQPTGGALRSLKPSTLKHKKSKKKLIETGQLRAEIDYRSRGDVRIISVYGNRSKVAGYLQFGTSKMEAFNWFGVSDEVMKKIKQYIEDEWESIMKKAA